MKNQNASPVSSFRRYLLVIVIFFFTLSRVPYTLVKAQDMSSEHFQLQGGNLNMTSGDAVSANFRLSDVLGETQATLFHAKGYAVQSGFENTAATSEFSFSVFPILIDYGQITPNKPVEKTVSLKIINGQLPGYMITAIVDGPLKTLGNAQILDTTCDSTTRPCTPGKAGIWKKKTSYGFGYSMDKDLFQPFPAEKREEQPVVILQSHQKNITNEAAMKLKIHVDRHQPVGNYHNTIRFIGRAGI